ncbi:hypothetical protein niasHS_017993 [Heterodera schachtii]|uniref:Uncharacterized protein n=1 Tax=Heterodera schachtii TaxID=97005 RepID=A0ABD2HSV9_HETSC
MLLFFILLLLSVEQQHEGHLVEKLQLLQTEEFQSLCNATEECAVNVKRVSTDSLELRTKQNAEEDDSLAVNMTQSQWGMQFAQYTHISFGGLHETAGINFATSGRLPEWRIEGRRRTAHHECAHAACHFVFDQADPVNYVYLRDEDADVTNGGKTGACGTEHRPSYTQEQFRQMLICVLAGEIGEYMEYNDAMPSLPDRAKLNKMAMIYFNQFVDKKKRKIKYYSKPPEKFLPKSKKKLEELSARGRDLCGDLQHEVLRKLDTAVVKKKMQKCATDLLVAQNGLLSRENLKHIFDTPASSSDDRWNQPPSHTQPPNLNFGQLKPIPFGCPFGPCQRALKPVAEPDYPIARVSGFEQLLEHNFDGSDDDIPCRNFAREGRGQNDTVRNSALGIRLNIC